MISTTPHPPRDISVGLFNVKPGIKIEDALVLASEYLLCAGATAYETVDNSTKEFRPLAQAVVHQIEAARALVQAAVAELEGRKKAV
ncbi:hypothetical protein PSCICN_31340 [Pseudomonas cichorii]|uniref:DUF6124 family protein n=1 Tax=Pseudomonas cichorii TaxID=36746 RepID=UPI001910FAE2|nr:hypothetical protein [Pseudomonas cichorii]GFM82442.1 hypothetical protein PSCICN_31340 [Pseudomonas cichorii]